MIFWSVLAIICVLFMWALISNIRDNFKAWKKFSKEDPSVFVKAKMQEANNRIVGAVMFLAITLLVLAFALDKLIKF